MIHVAAAAIFGPDGRLLVSRRHAHQHQGGFWEFPGGKVEPGEAVETALCRELQEELGIMPTCFAPLISVPFQYPDKQVLLDVWVVTAYQGEPQGLEGQPLRWVAVSELNAEQFPPANRPIVSALQLPSRCLITGCFGSLEELVSRTHRALQAGVKLVQLRMPAADRDSYRQALLALSGLVREQGGLLIANTDPTWVAPHEVDGLHLNRHRVAQLSVSDWEKDLLPWRGSWLGASCHNTDELQRAQTLGVDYVNLSPVLPTGSHPGAAVLGWDGLRTLCQQAAVPAYALGGVGSENLEQVRAAGAQGVAAISAFWELAQ